MSVITHEVRDGFCIQCGDTEEWLRATGETVNEAAPAEVSADDVAYETLRAHHFVSLPGLGAECSCGKGYNDRYGPLQGHISREIKAAVKAATGTLYAGDELMHLRAKAERRMDAERVA